MRSKKCKNMKGKGMTAEERGKFSGVQRGLSIDANELRTSLRELFRDMLHEGYEKGLGKGRADAHELRTSLRELFRDMLQKGYGKGLGKGRAPGFVAGYHKGLERRALLVPSCSKRRRTSDAREDCRDVAGA